MLKCGLKYSKDISLEIIITDIPLEPSNTEDNTLSVMNILENKLAKIHGIVVNNDTAKYEFDSDKLTLVMNAANDGYRGGGGLDGAVWKRFSNFGSTSSTPRNDPSVSLKFTFGTESVYLDHYDKTENARVVHCVGPNIAGKFQSQDVLASAKTKLEGQYKAYFECVNYVVENNSNKKIDLLVTLLSTSIYGYNYEKVQDLRKLPKNSSLNIMLAAYETSGLMNNPNVLLVLNVYRVSDNDLILA
jgi:hypothetical protein